MNVRICFTDRETGEVIEEIPTYPLVRFFEDNEEAVRGCRTAIRDDLRRYGNHTHSGFNVITELTRLRRAIRC